MYTDAKDVTAENWARACWIADHRKLEVMRGALEVVLEVVMSVPAAAADARDRPGRAGRWFDWLCGIGAGLSRPVGKPDADNLAKLYLDGLNGVAWLDDSQVVTLLVVKRYGDGGGDGEGVRLYARELPGWLPRPG